MNNVFVFTPQSKLDAKQNLEHFILRCRDECLAFGSDLNFDENIWDISGTISTKGRIKAVRVIFSNYSAAVDDHPKLSHFLEKISSKTEPRD